MKRIKSWIDTSAVIVLPPVLLFCSNWGYGALETYRAKSYSALPLLLYTVLVYTALGILLGWLTTRFEDKDAWRRGVLSFTGGLLPVLALGMVYVLERQGIVDLPTWLHNALVKFDLRELYLWGGVYLLQIIRRSLPAGKLKPKLAGEAAVRPSYGSKGNTAAMLCVMLLPALVLLVSAYAQNGFAAPARGYGERNIQMFLRRIPYWNIGFYTISGVLFGAVPWLRCAEENRLRCAVAVTFGLSGIILLGMLYSLWLCSAMPVTFLTFLNLNEVFLWTGLYLYLMASLLRQGYRGKTGRGT